MKSDWTISSEIHFSSEEDAENSIKNHETKTKITLAIAGIIVLSIAGVIGQIRQNSRDEYARRNNCVWHATGSYYGDDRDFICK